MNYLETYWIPGISVEDAWRVEDPTSILKPCKNPAGVRSLVLAESNEKCLKEELLHYQNVLPQFNFFKFRQIIDPATGALDLKQAGLITYCHGHYYRLGEEIGHFGWTVRKHPKK